MKKKLRDYKAEYKDDESKLKDLEEIEIHFGIEECKRVQESIEKYNKIKNMRHKVNHVASVHNEGGFFCYMAERYKKTDRNWKSSPQKIGEVISEIEAFLKNFYDLAEKAKEKNVKSIDLE